MSLYEELKKFQKKDGIRFHIPGHNGGRGLNPDWVKDAFSLDVTEFEETDDLQNPTGILKDAQSRVAALHGAKASFFLTGGSSLGIRAAILAACKPGEKILVDRTCHKAVASAMVLSGCIPVFLSPEFSEEFGLYTGISPKKVEDAIQKDPQIKGMILTSPTYYGVVSPVGEIGQVLHKMERFLIVDEAHGAHFPFHDGLPEPALSLGADVVISSAHKTLPALGQTSLLHLGEKSLISEEKLASSLRLLMTTSPSYLLMSSLDEAVSFMERSGRAFLEILLKKVKQLKTVLRKQGILDFADEERLGVTQDSLRLVVDFRKSGFSGNEAAELLKNAYGIYPEMADSSYVVMVVTVSNTVEELEKLQSALLEIATPGDGGEGMNPLPVPKMAMSPREGWYQEKEMVSLQEAEGRISADIVAVCPPGSAILIPGQYMDRETVKRLEQEDDVDGVSVVKE